MTLPVLSRAVLRAGVWEAVLETGGQQDAPPRLELLLGTEVVAHPEVLPAGPGSWQIRVGVPLGLLNQGVQVFLVREIGQTDLLGHFTLIAGDDMGDDLRGTVMLLRAELDLLKQSFRRHMADQG